MIVSFYIMKQTNFDDETIQRINFRHSRTNKNPRGAIAPGGPYCKTRYFYGVKYVVSLSIGCHVVVGHHVCLRSYDIAYLGPRHVGFSNLQFYGDKVTLQIQDRVPRLVVDEI